MVLPDELHHLILNDLAPGFPRFSLTHHGMYEPLVLSCFCDEVRYPLFADMELQGQIIVLLMIHDYPMDNLNLLSDGQWPSLDLSPSSSWSLFHQVSLIILTFADFWNFRATSSHFFGVLSHFLIIFKLLH